MRGGSKYLLKQVLYSYLPAELFNRPKWGFSIPLNRWLAGPLKLWLLDTLSEDRLRHQSLIEPAVVSALLRRYLGGDEHLYARLWAVTRVVGS
jgi:asparagine synthase (glutamine-hydrolysing)